MVMACSEALPRFNFASGPAMLPPEVLRQACEALTDWRGTGLSVLELPFSGAEFTAILDDAEQRLRDLLDIPADYRVLFLQGGASAHFTFVPMNLLGENDQADYVVNGVWSRRALVEAKNLCHARIAAQGDRAIPPQRDWVPNANAAYCHITTNETADGLQFHWLPELDEVPVVADMSADLLTRPVDVSRFGLIYASAQKNLGIAGLTVVILRPDVLQTPRFGTSAVFDYGRQVVDRSKVNTPPTFAIFMAGLMLAWMQAQGGLTALAVRNRRKAEALYAAIDASNLFSCPVSQESRSLTNVCFRLPTPSMEADFLAATERHRLLNLKGHPAVGGLRANLYNVLPPEAVTALIGLMEDFEHNAGVRGASV